MEIALAAQPVGVMAIGGIAIAEVNLHDDGSDFRVRQEWLALDDVNDLLGNRLETRRLFGRVALQLVLVVYVGGVGHKHGIVVDSLRRTQAIALELGLMIVVSQYLLSGGKGGELTRLLNRRVHLPRLQLSRVGGLSLASGGWLVRTVVLIGRSV